MPKLKKGQKRRFWPFGRRERGKKRWSPASLTGQLRNTALGAGAILLIALVVIFIKTDLPARAWHQSVESGWRLSGNMGLRVEELVVYGLRRTSAGDARAALAIERGMPILRVDLHDAYDRLTSLPWVKTARIRRQLPDQVVVEIEERTPLAIWRVGRRMGIIDTVGEQIMPVVPRGLENLPMITGEDANEAAPTLLASLKRRPDLSARIAASTRIASRRWDLVMDNGVIARLPAEGIDRALDELITVINDQTLAGRDLLAIDLRQDDRILVGVPDDVAAWLAERKEKS